MQRLRILVAEDDAIIRKNLCQQLIELGHEVTASVDNGKEAVTSALQSTPDAVLMDINMPGMDGIEAATQIGQQCSCMVIFLTGLLDPATVDRAANAGAVAYLLKPYRKADLAPTFEIASRRFAEIGALKAEVGGLKLTLAARKSIERAKGVLMKNEGLSEDEAYKRIHFAARNENRTMKEVADNILSVSGIAS